MSKFEQLLDYLVNEDHEKANELFHEIVVEKSREIYENLIAEEADEEEDEGIEEAFGEEEAETVETMFGEEDDEMDADDSFPVQDKTDDFEDDVADDEFGGLGDDEGDMDAPADKGDIKDLEDALEELKAEFEKLMAGEKDEPEHADMFGGEEGDDEEGDDLASDDDEEEDEGKFAFESSEDDEDEEVEEGAEEDEDEDEGVTESRGPKSQGERMREYIEKVTATMDGGLVGGRTGETMSGPKEGKSPVSSGSGKPTSGATAKNIAQADMGANEDGTSPKGKVSGLTKTGGQFVGAGTKNVASSANAKKPDGAKLDAVKKPGNKEGEGWGAGKGDKAGQTGSVDTNSPINGAPNRAK